MKINVGSLGLCRDLYSYDLKTFKKFGKYPVCRFQTTLRLTPYKVIICKCCICPFRQKTKLVAYDWFSTGSLRALFTYQSFSDFLLVSWNLGLIRISIQYFLYLLKISFQGSIELLALFMIFYCPIAKTKHTYLTVSLSD